MLGGALLVEPKLRPLKASFRSPKAEDAPPEGPCIPPKDGCFSCRVGGGAGGCACGLGVEA